MTYKQELNPPLKIDAISENDLLNFGVQDLAYIRKVNVGKDLQYMIHAADGALISSVQDHNSALAAVLRNDLELTALH